MGNKIDNFVKKSVELLDGSHEAEKVLSLVNNVVAFFELNEEHDFFEEDLETCILQYTVLDMLYEKYNISCHRDEIFEFHGDFYMPMEKIVSSSNFGINALFIPEGLIVYGKLLSIRIGKRVYINTKLLDFVFESLCEIKKIPNNKPNIVCENTYIIYDNTSNLYKIGKAKDIEKRLKTLSIGNPNLKLMVSINENIESHLHKKYESLRYSGEWFSLSNAHLIEICKLNNPDFIDDTIKWMID